MTDTTVYDAGDLLWLSRGMPLGLLMNAGTAIHVLRDAAEVAVHIEHLLASEEEIWSEPMEFVHACLRCKGAYDAEMRDDLLVRNNHRKLQTLGGILTFLSPRDDDLAILEQSIAAAAPCPWIVHLAAKHLRGERVIENREHLLLLLSIRETLNPVETASTRLRRASDIPTGDIADLRERMRVAYHANGAEAAHLVLKRAEAEDSALGRYLTERLMPV